MTNAEGALFEDDYVKIPGEPDVRVKPEVDYFASNPSLHLFDFPIRDSPSLTHTFDLLLAKDSYYVVESPERELVTLESSGRWAKLQVIPNAVVEPRTARDGDGFLVARLVVYEWVENHRSAARAGWRDVLDVEADPAELVEMVEEISSDREGRYEMTLFDGSLFLLKELNVHPAFRGQKIGVRLMAHAMRTLNRSTGDLFVCQVMPVRGLFSRGESEEPIITREAVKRLAAYYRKLGMSTWRKSEKENDPIVLWHMGAFKFPWN